MVRVRNAAFLLVALLVVATAEARSAKNAANLKLNVDSCEENSKSRFTLRRTGNIAGYLERVTISGARPNRPVFMTSYKDDSGTTKKRPFRSACGTDAGHDGLVTSMKMNLSRLISWNHMKGRADANGEVTFKVPVPKCGKMYYQAYDWTNNKNCEQTNVANLHYQPPPPPVPVAAAAPTNPCSGCVGAMKFYEINCNEQNNGGCGGDAQDFTTIRSSNYIMDQPCELGNLFDYADYDGDDLMHPNSPGAPTSSGPEPDMCVTRERKISDDTLDEVAAICVTTLTNPTIADVCGPTAAFV